jgi:putative transposase
MPETRNYKFRLYPTANQEVKLQNNLAVCRWVYNRLLDINKNGLPSVFDMCKMLTELKESESWLYEYDAKMLQIVCYQLDGARKALKASLENGHKTGTLKFVKYNEYSSFTYNQRGYKLIKHGDTNLLKLSKIGHIEIRLSREIPENSIIKQIIITKKSGKWFACVTVDISNSIILSEIPKISFKKSVGIDVGIKSFVYDSNGYNTANPKILRISQKKLAKTQKKISKKIR